jgi:hypothetical protein
MMGQPTGLSFPVCARTNVTLPYSKLAGRLLSDAPAFFWRQRVGGAIRKLSGIANPLGVDVQESLRTQAATEWQ